MFSVTDVVRIEHVTAHWLSDLLNANVEALDAVPVGTGQVGATYRLMLTGDGVPPTLIGKFAATDPVSRASGVAQGSYIREAGFYRDLAPRAALPVPDILHVAIDQATQDFAIIMEDFPGHRAGNQLEPVRIADAAAIVDALGTIHAAWWDDPVLDTLDYLPGAAGAAKREYDPLYAALWPAFVDRYGTRVTPVMRQVGSAYVGRVDQWAEPRVTPRCLVHGDFRHDNMLFGSNPPIVVVDWQTAAVGCGATDLAYFAGTSLDPSDRREHEIALFDRWHAHVRSDRAPLWRAYRRDAFAGFIMAVAASMIVGRTDRGDAMFLAMSERAAIMAIDWDSISLL